MVFHIGETACCRDQCTSSVLNNSICFEQIYLLFMLLFHFHLIFSTWSHSFPLASTMATNPQYLEGCPVHHTAAWRSAACVCYTLCGSVCFRFVSKCVKYVYLVRKYVERCTTVRILCVMCVLFMEVCIQSAACKSGLLALIWPSMPTRAALPIESLWQNPFMNLQPQSSSGSSFIPFFGMKEWLLYIMGEYVCTSYIACTFLSATQILSPLNCSTCPKKEIAKKIVLQGGITAKFISIIKRFL